MEHNHQNGSVSVEADIIERDIEYTRDHLVGLIDELIARVKNLGQWKVVLARNKTTIGIAAIALLFLLLLRRRPPRPVIILDSSDLIRILGRGREV